MRLDHVEAHRRLLNRRDALKLGAGGLAAAVAGPTLLNAAAGAAPAAQNNHSASPASNDPFTDEMFRLEDVPGWFPSFYGPGDEKGTYNEVTPQKTASALATLAGAEAVRTYWLGELEFNGMPAFPITPPRLHPQVLAVYGIDLGADFGGIQGFTEPLGPNKVFWFEERFRENMTYQIGTQLDGLNHLGVDGYFYNGFRGEDIAADYGTTRLGNETMGPIVTRGVVIDIIGLKVAAGATEDFFIAPNGKPVLKHDYRITLEDIFQALWRQRVDRQIGPGDVVVLRTGWTHLIKDDPEGYLTSPPGIFLRESRYFAAQRTAIVGTDTWGLESLNPEVTGDAVFPVHQELLAKHGIRIGESIVTEDLVADHVYDFVYCYSPEKAEGATAGSPPPIGLGTPGPPPR